jgi:hypothetical protein
MPGVRPQEDMAQDVASISSQHLWLERAVVVLAAGIYLYFFQAQLPNGDGRVYIRQIQDGHTVWNPNHLLMQPVGLWFYQLGRAVGLSWSAFAALKILSGASTLITLGLFHSVLSVLPIRSRTLRLGGVAALFSSAHFLSMAIAEEFYMLQMPLLMAALLVLAFWVTGRYRAASEWVLLGALGLLVALASAVSINNAALGFVLGVLVASPLGRSGQWSIRNALWVWGAGAAVAIPLFVGTYLVTRSDVGFVPWLSSYQGQAGNPADALYGATLSVSGLAISAATLVYGFATSLFTLGELGAVAESAVRSRALEFVPDVLHLATSVILFVVIAVLSMFMAVWFIRSGRRLPAAVAAVAWIGAYLLFNLYWSDTSDQFWFQVLPAFWMLIVLGLSSEERRGATMLVWSRRLIPVIAVFLLMANTTSSVAPRAFANVEDKRQQFANLLRPGDLLITTGWDDLAWMTWDDGQPYSRVLLMDLAMTGRQNEQAMEQLVERIRTHLSSGRVVVARVFDLDREGRPWEQLAKLRWPRSRLQKLLGVFPNSVVGTVDGVVFRELRVPAP